MTFFSKLALTFVEMRSCPHVGGPRPRLGSGSDAYQGLVEAYSRMLRISSRSFQKSAEKDSKKQAAHPRDPDENWGRTSLNFFEEIFSTEYPRQALSGRACSRSGSSQEEHKSAQRRGAPKSLPRCGPIVEPFRKQERSPKRTRIQSRPARTDGVNPSLRACLFAGII